MRTINWITDVYVLIKYDKNAFHKSNEYICIYKPGFY